MAATSPLSVGRGGARRAPEIVRGGAAAMVLVDLLWMLLYLIPAVTGKLAVSYH